MLIRIDDIDLAPQDAEAALRSLERMAARLRARQDPRAVFPDIHAVIPRRVLEAVRGDQGPTFRELAWISRLAARSEALRAAVLRRMERFSTLMAFTGA